MSKDFESGSAPDPFDPARLRLDPSYAGTIGVKKLLTTVSVRKPTPQEFVRVHPATDYSLNAAIIELKDESETYILEPDIAHQLPNEFKPTTLFTTLNRQGVLFLWPVRLPDPDGKENPWYRSARVAAEKAMSAWVRVMSNRSLGAYELYEASGNLPEPEWPDFSFTEILRVAFRERRVDNMDHPLLRRLRGEA